MRRTLWVPIAVFVAGMALIAMSVAEGDVEVSLFIIFPVFTGSSPLFLLAILLIISSFIAGFVLLTIDQTRNEGLANAPHKGGNGGAPKSKIEYGGVVLIGPIPIAFGSNRRMALIMLIIGIAVAVVLLAVLLSAI